MSDINSFLKVLKKYGYPNENFDNLCRLSSYNPDSFLQDMVDNFGEDKTLEFVGKALDKLSGKEGIRIPLWEPDEFVYLIIEDYYVNVEESEDCVFIEWTWGDSRVMDDMGRMTTLKGLEDDNDPWDLDEFYDQLKEKCSYHIQSLTGFYLCWGI